MNGLYIDARNGADLESLLETLVKLSSDQKSLTPLLEWLKSYGISVSGWEVSSGRMSSINWLDSPLDSSFLHLLGDLLSDVELSITEEVQLVLILSLLRTLNIKNIYFSPLATGTEHQTLQLLIGQRINFSGYTTSPGIALLAKKLGKKINSTQEMVLTNFAESKSDLTSYLFDTKKPTEDQVSVLQFQIDDINPEFLGYLQEKVFQSGALDYFTTPIQMKKNRPGTLVSILCHPEALRSFADLIFQETSTIGVRYHQESRFKAERELIWVTTAYGNIRVKISKWIDNNGKTHFQYSPEYEDCRNAAQTLNIPLKEIYASALYKAREGKKNT